MFRDGEEVSKCEWNWIRNNKISDRKYSYKIWSNTYSRNLQDKRE